MTEPRDVRFETQGSVSVPSGSLTPLELSPRDDPSPHLALEDAGIVFRTEGWYEVLLEVQWDPAVIDGTRFSHTKIPDQHPLHSEAIAAQVLVEISGGQQLLRGNTMFGPDRTTSLVLEVWQDSRQPVDVRSAALTVRELRVPWSPEPAAG